MKIFCLLFLVLLSCGNSKQLVSICFADKKFETLEATDFDDLEEEMEGSIIKVEGILRFNFEDVAIYPDRNSHSNYAFWLDFNEQFKDHHGKELRKMNGQRIRAIGLLNLQSKGHLSSYKGTLDSVFCIKTIN